VTVTGGGALAVVSLDFEGTTEDEGRPGLAELEFEGTAVTVMPPGGVGLLGLALAGSLADETGRVVVFSGVELGNVKLADVLGRAVLETVSMVHSSPVSAETDLELLKIVLLELIDDDEEVLLDSLQTPGDNTPTKHLHDVEQGLPGAPLASFPLSHSSPNDASILPSPQPTGVAPRAMMYGIPEDPSAYDSSPSPVALRAIAKASKPSVPGWIPFFGNSVKTS
jgi:hypothetical protein